MGRPRGGGRESLNKFQNAMHALPLVAILRGLKPTEALAIGTVLFDAGFRLIEVPLNSPQPLESIALLKRQFPQAVVGAGTVLKVEELRAVAAAGGELIVAPNFNREVVAETVKLGLTSLPGILTPTEAFAALDAGAHGLKLFPSEIASPAVVKAMLAVLPKGTPIVPVGGIGPHGRRDRESPVAKVHKDVHVLPHVQRVRRRRPRWDPVTLQRRVLAVASHHVMADEDPWRRSSSRAVGPHRQRHVAGRGIARLRRRRRPPEKLAP